MDMLYLILYIVSLPKTQKEKPRNSPQSGGFALLHSRRRSREDSSS